MLIQQPIFAPIRQPIFAPIRQPIFAPIRLPIFAPIRLPIFAPIRLPIFALAPLLAVFSETQQLHALFVTYPVALYAAFQVSLPPFVFFQPLRIIALQEAPAALLFFAFPTVFLFPFRHQPQAALQEAPTAALHEAPTAALHEAPAALQESPTAAFNEFQIVSPSRPVYLFRLVFPFRLQPQATILALPQLFASLG